MDKRKKKNISNREGRAKKILYKALNKEVENLKNDVAFMKAIDDELEACKNREDIKKYIEKAFIISKQELEYENRK